MKFAINGFGRIGRTAFRVWFEKHAEQAELVGVNTSGSMDIEGWAYLLKYDSNYGVWPVGISTEEHQKKDAVTDQDPLLGYVHVGNRRIAFLAQKDPAKLPWSQLGVETVIESTGVFITKEKASLHLTAGANRVVISAPPKGDDVSTFVLGVNEATGIGVESNASCTTNCVAPVAAVMHQMFHVKKAMMSTIHSYTDDQNLQDNSHRDLRRARSAAKNIVPTTTGAAQSVAETIPELKGLFDGVSYRVPTSVGSLAETVFLVEKKTTVEEVNAALEQAAQQPRWRGILAVTKEPIVSSDIIGRSESSIVDLALTQVVDGDMVKVVAWYDNEFGYCNRLVEQVANHL
jgi:glyceraldehyde 3-phosphate dehydrogenase